MQRLYFDFDVHGYVTLDKKRVVAFSDTSFLGEGRPTVRLQNYGDQDELVGRVEEFARGLPREMKPDAFSCVEIIPGTSYALDFLRIRGPYVSLLENTVNVAQAAK